MITMKTHNRYLIYLVYFILTIPAVILLFKSIEPKKLASLFAATLFISCSFLIFWGEYKYNFLRSFSFWAAVFFLVVFSGPMLMVRLLYYGIDFSEIQIWGFSGPDFHKYSNYGFWVLLVAPLLDYLKTKRLLSAASSK